jgi:hypothetical protein
MDLPFTILFFNPIFGQIDSVNTKNKISKPIPLNGKDIKTPKGIITSTK